MSVRDLQRRDQRAPKGNPPDIIRHELAAEAGLHRLQGRPEESLDEVAAHGSGGERHPGLGRPVATTTALQARMSHGDTEQLERPVERMLTDREELMNPRRYRKSVLGALRPDGCYFKRDRIFLAWENGGILTDSSFWVIVAGYNLEIDIYGDTRRRIKAECLTSVSRVFYVQIDRRGTTNWTCSPRVFVRERSGTKGTYSGRKWYRHANRFYLPITR